MGVPFGTGSTRYAPRAAKQRLGPSGDDPRSGCACALTQSYRRGRASNVASKWTPRRAGPQSCAGGRQADAPVSSPRKLSCLAAGAADRVSGRPCGYPLARVGRANPAPSASADRAARPITPPCGGTARLHPLSRARVHTANAVEQAREPGQGARPRQPSPCVTWTGQRSTGAAGPSERSFGAASAKCSSPVPVRMPVSAGRPREGSEGAQGRGQSWGGSTG